MWHQSNVRISFCCQETFIIIASNRDSQITDKIILLWIQNGMYPTVTSARSCNNVGHLFWFTILAQHETNDVILYIHSVHKYRGNTFQRQNYKMRLKRRSLKWIKSCALLNFDRLYVTSYDAIWKRGGKQIWVSM